MTKWGRELNSKYIVLQRYVTQILKSDKYQLINLKNEDKDFWLPEEDNKVSIGISWCIRDVLSPVLFSCW